MELFLSGIVTGLWIAVGVCIWKLNQLEKQYHNECKNFVEEIEKKLYHE
jgi:hypothetical protein